MLVMISGAPSVSLGLVLISSFSVSVTLFFGVDLNLGSGEGSGLGLRFSVGMLGRAVIPSVVMGPGLPRSTVPFSTSLS